VKCCHLTRREFLRYAALVAATPLVSSVLEPERAYAQMGSGVALPFNLELVTVTETSMVVTWFTGDPTQVDTFGRLAPVPTDTELLLGTSPVGLATVHHDPTPTPYHYVEITGLEPETPYFFVARSNGVPAVTAVSFFGNPLGTSAFAAAPSGPFAFTTPAPPPGKFLFALALSNDMHLGETLAGLATTQAGVGIPPGIGQIDGRPPYTEVMAAALAAETRARGVDLLLVDGDVTSEARPPEVTGAKGLLDRFGVHGRDYFVTRGNHDRVHTGQPDTFGAAFFPGVPTWWEHDAYGLRIVGLDTYDKSGDGADNGSLSARQWSFLRGRLGADKDRPTLVLGHHPVTAEATVTTIPPIRFDMDLGQAAELEALYAATPGVFLHHSGHTHRNKRTLSTTATDVVFQESAAVKEYPGGFTLLRVFSGGYALNFYKFNSPLALEWSERSRPEYLGLAPLYEFGAAIDRNSVVARDFSGLSSPRDIVTTTTAVAPARAQPLAVTGTREAAVSVAAAGATAAALAARRAGRMGVARQNDVVNSSKNSSNTATAASASAVGDRNRGRSAGPSSSA
jgi:hypothetical protein